MKKSIWLLFFLLSAAGIYAQTTEAAPEKRADFILSAGLLGDVSLISVSFDKLFFLKPDLILSTKLGFGFNQEFNIFTTSTPPTNYFVLPLHVTCSFGKNKNFLECGVGGAMLSGGDAKYYLVYPILGYRFHPFKNQKFCFRAWLYFPFGQVDIAEDSEVFFVPAGVSVGITL